MFFWVLIIVLVVLIGVLIYRKGTKNATYFKDRNIPYLKPQFMMGNMKEMFSYSQGLLVFGMEMIRLHKGSP